MISLNVLIDFLNHSSDNHKLIDIQPSICSKTDYQNTLPHNHLDQKL